MLEEDSTKQSLSNLLASLCNEAMAEETEANPSIKFYSKAPRGKTIDQESITISLNSQGYISLQEATTRLRRDKKLRLEFSKKEVEEEVITSMFEGVKATQDGHFDAKSLTDSLLVRLAERHEPWDIYLPIEGLELPDKEQLSLASGIFKEMTYDDKNSLRLRSVDVWRQAKQRPSSNKESVIPTLSQWLDDIIGSSKMLFQTRAWGRQEAAKDQAVEAAVLAMDILAFFATVNQIDPEVFACHLPFKKGGVMGYFQISKTGGGPAWESGAPFPYTLDSSRYARLTNLKEFRQIQAISNSNNPNQVERRFLLGIQQYAEATRLPSLSTKLVWYLSALETVLVKETEGHRHKKIEARMRKLFGDSAAREVAPLYDKRRKSVHYGYRNRVGEEYIEQADTLDARALSYLGIMLALKHSEGFGDVDAFLGHIDRLDDNNI